MASFGSIINLLAMDPNKSSIELIMATVYLKSESGKSLLHQKSMGAVDPSPYIPSSDTIEKTVSELRRLGFKIESQGVTVSISGPSELFEQICGVKIWAEERTVNMRNSIESSQLKIYRSSEPVLQIQKLKHMVDGILLAVPGIPFEDHFDQR